MIAAVAASYIGDVPHGIGSCCILQRSAAQGIRKSERMELSFVGKVRIDICNLGVAVLLYPFSVFEKSLVQAVLHVTILLFLSILCFQIFVADGIQQAGTVNADSRFQQDFIITQTADDTFVFGIDRVWSESHLRIFQIVTLTIGKLVAPLVGIFFPFDNDFAFVQRGFEGLGGMSLWHSGQPAYISIGIRIVDNQQTSVPDCCRLKGT